MSLIDIFLIKIGLAGQEFAGRSDIFEALSLFTAGRSLNNVLEDMNNVEQLNILSQKGHQLLEVLKIIGGRPQSIYALFKNIQAQNTPHEEGTHLIKEVGAILGVNLLDSQKFQKMSRTHKNYDKINKYFKKLRPSKAQKTQILQHFFKDIGVSPSPLLKLMGIKKEVHKETFKKQRRNIAEISFKETERPALIRAAQEWDFLTKREMGKSDLEKIVGTVAMQENKVGKLMTGSKELLQFMDPTARKMSITKLFDLGHSWKGGEKYLKYLLKYYKGGTAKTLAAYHWGQGHGDNDLTQNGVNWQECLPQAPHDIIGKVTGRYLSGKLVDIDNVLHGTRAASNAVHPQHITHHHDTTHNNPHITVNVTAGTHASPHETARAIHQELSRALMSANNRTIM